VGKLKEAEKAFRKGLSVEAGKFGWYGIAKVKEAEGKPQDALEILQKLVNDDSEDERTYMLIGELMQKYFPENAREFFENALSMHPEFKNLNHFYTGSMLNQFEKNVEKI
jgi:tetratricopeptide (TPR) repeat protein